MSDCKTCKENREPETVPYMVHESAMARAERKDKRQTAVIILLILLLVGCFFGWMHERSQFETVKTTYEASTDNGGLAIANGSSESQSNGD